MIFKASWKLSLLAISIFLCDALLKMYVHCSITPMNFSFFPYGGIGIFHEFGIEFVITHVINKGAMWGLFANYQLLLVAIRILIISALGYYLYIKQMSHYRRVGLVMILAGAAGNVFDCIIYGHVIDMFCFVFWGYIYPVFNVADVAIFCGILMLLLETPSSKAVASSLK